jgi:hypothetical protein
MFENPTELVRRASEAANRELYAEANYHATEAIAVIGDDPEETPLRETAESLAGIARRIMGRFRSALEVEMSIVERRENGLLMESTNSLEARRDVLECCIHLGAPIATIDTLFEMADLGVRMTGAGHLGGVELHRSRVLKDRGDAEAAYARAVLAESLSMGQAHTYSRGSFSQAVAGCALAIGRVEEAERRYSALQTAPSQWSRLAGNLGLGRIALYGDDVPAASRWARTAIEAGAWLHPLALQYAYELEFDCCLARSDDEAARSAGRELLSLSAEGDSARRRTGAVLRALRVDLPIPESIEPHTLVDTLLASCGEDWLRVESRDV